MIKAGLTGNIGSGKSIVAKIFRTLGVPVFDADASSRQLTQQPEILQQIAETFGAHLIVGESLDRKALAEIVFKDSEKLDLLNQIIHPAVHAAFAKWASQQSSAYVLYEAAIIAETGRAGDLDTLIVVTAPQKLRLQRVMKRDNASREMVLQRMKNQWPEEKKVAAANYVIYNDNSRLVIPQVLTIDAALRKVGRA
ncbi:MAG TPA: dephospho-CoA kinase [Bacteroidales bacterium]|nr:dephospho-CoA kinase [Bacteroidales bacterium]